ncbi:MAG: type II secretion system F family protein [Lachnospiraceae bacterium]|nr:type II secretion system F family protein [Lachnospiraceae bacterium]MDE6253738.1 type II secretion system F family protein [Lachnospiraceae bacterium]
MPNFKYVAYSKDGKEVKGSIEAVDQEDAAKKIKEQGQMVVKVEAEGALDKDLNLSFGKKKASSRDLSVFCRQFVSISTAGVAIVDALEMLGDQTENKALQEAIFNVEASVQKGETLAGSMRKQNGIFPSIMVNMVEAGESSGNLEVSFERMAIQFEKSTKIQQLVKKSMIYPIALSVIVVGVVVLMMAFVVPTFSDMYADMDQQLPALTRMVVAISDFVVDRWYILIAAIVIAVIGFKVFAASKTGMYVLADVKRKIPIFGKLTIKSSSAQFARNLSTLTAAGISMIDALDIVAKTMPNIRFRDAVLEAKEKVAQGRPLSEPLKAGGIFPNMIIHMIGIGEETGNMDDMLITAATYFEEEVEAATEQVAAIIEPLLIVVMAGIVGVIIMSILIPMFGMYDLAGGGEV